MRLNGVSPIQTINQAHKTSGRRAGPSRDLTTADLVVLSLLSERPMHGYDLLGEYQRQEVVDWASVSKAQLYYALGKLAERGHIKGQAEEAAVRERTIYAPTERGKTALRNALADPAWATRRIAQPFATWLGLSIHAADADYRDMQLARRIFLVAEIAKEQASLAFIDTINSDRAKRGADIVTLIIQQLAVELEWVDAMIARSQ
jgi:DNA-binding PadR family transcriptional regulator